MQTVSRSASEPVTESSQFRPVSIVSVSDSVSRREVTFLTVQVNKATLFCVPPTTSLGLVPCCREDRCRCDSSQCDSPQLAPLFQRSATIFARCVSAGPFVAREPSEQSVEVRSEFFCQLDYYFCDGNPSFRVFHLVSLAHPACAAAGALSITRVPPRCASGPGAPGLCRRLQASR